MKIRGRKEFIIALVVISFTTFIIVASFFLFYQGSINRYLPQLSVLIAAWASLGYVFVKFYLTYYTVDTTGVTEHLFSKSRTFRWDECCFIKRIVVSGRIYDAAQQVIICSRHIPPKDYDDIRLSTYNWPQKETIKIRNATDEIYSEFLKWCGGEKDIRS